MCLVQLRRSSFVNDVGRQRCPLAGCPDGEDAIALLIDWTTFSTTSKPRPTNDPPPGRPTRCADGSPQAAGPPRSPRSFIGSSVKGANSDHAWVSPGRRSAGKSPGWPAANPIATNEPPQRRKYFASRPSGRKQNPASSQAHTTPKARKQCARRRQGGHLGDCRPPPSRRGWSARIQRRRVDHPQRPHGAAGSAGRRRQHERGTGHGAGMPRARMTPVRRRSPTPARSWTAGGATPLGQFGGASGMGVPRGQAGLKLYTWPALVAATTRRSNPIDTPTGETRGLGQRIAVERSSAVGGD